VNWLIIGAGAIGCLVGGKLAALGENVTLVGRPHFAESVREQGLVLTGVEGTQRIQQLRALGSVAEAFADPAPTYDIAVLTVKSYDTASALAELQSALAPTQADAPMILSLQNGVGNEALIAEAFGWRRVIAGTITTPVKVISPGVIHIEKPKHFIGLSQWNANRPTGRLLAMEESFTHAGIRVKKYPNAEAMKWTKLLMNMVANATSAILDEPPAQVFADPAMADLELAAWREALAVMQRARLQPVNVGSYPFRWLAPLIRTLPNAWLRPILRRQVAGARGNKMPSLQLDLAAGKGRSEIAWLNGAVVTLGEELGVPTPVNRGLTTIMQQVLADPSQWAAWRQNHAKLRATLRAG
jgi:2-dehydropantoate 2-reductase